MTLLMPKWSGSKAPTAVLKLKRQLAKGLAWNVTVFDLNTEWTFDAQQSCSKSKNLPFDGSGAGPWQRW